VKPDLEFTSPDAGAPAAWLNPLPLDPVVGAGHPWMARLAPAGFCPAGLPLLSLPVE
jgi:hypothetical protein